MQKMYEYFSGYHRKRQDVDFIKSIHAFSQCKYTIAIMIFAAFTKYDQDQNVTIKGDKLCSHTPLAGNVPSSITV